MARFSDFGVEPPDNIEDNVFLLKLHVDNKSLRMIFLVFATDFILKAILDDLYINTTPFLFNFNKFPKLLEYILTFPKLLDII